MKSSKCNSVWNSNLRRCVHLIGKPKSTTANMRKSNTSHRFIPLSDSFKQTKNISFSIFMPNPPGSLATHPNTSTTQSIHTHKAPMRKLLLMIPIAMYFHSSRPLSTRLTNAPMNNNCTAADSDALSESNMPVPVRAFELTVQQSHRE